MPYAALPSLLQNDVALHVRCTATVYSTASNTVAIVAIALHAVCSECVQKQFSAAVKIFCYYYMLLIHHCTHCILRRILSTISHIAMCDERRDEQLCYKCIAAGAKREKESLAALLSLQ